MGGDFLENYILIELKNSYPLFDVFKNTGSPYNPSIMASMDATLGQICQEIQSCKLAYASQYRALLIFSFTGRDKEIWLGPHKEKRLSMICSKFTLYFNKVFSYRIEMHCTLDASKYDDQFKFAQDYVRWRKDRLALYGMKDMAFFTGTSTEVFKDELKDYINYVQFQDYNRLLVDSYRIKCNKYVSNTKKKHIISALEKIGFDIHFSEFVGRFGIFCFKAPKLFYEGKENQTVRIKWTCDRNPPLIKQSPEYLNKFFKIQ